MSDQDIDDANDFWWAWQENDERFRRHQEMRAELAQIAENLRTKPKDEAHEISSKSNR